MKLTNFFVLNIRYDMGMPKFYLFVEVVGVRVKMQFTSVEIYFVIDYINKYLTAFFFHRIIV